MSIRLILISIVGLLIIGCSSHGKVKEFDGLEIFYHNDADIAEVTKLGEYLTSVKFTNGDQKSLQFLRTDTTITVKMIVDSKILTNDSILLLLKDFRKDLNSSIYTGTQFELHLCDKYFETKKVLNSNE